MIYDHRTYKCKPGTINKQLAQYKELGYEAQVRNLGKPLVYAATEIGDVNCYIHIWVYDDIADRAAKRAKLMADPDWLAYLAASAESGYLISQENIILKPTGL